MARRLRIVLFVAAACASVLTPAAVSRAAAPPTPDPAFINNVPAGKCTAESPYEEQLYGHDRYGARCRRIKFAFGPIVVRPGQNDALIGPVTIEKPAFDGFITRFKPDLVRASDGSHPPVEELHLHHATWLALTGDYGDNPFFAAGEEKTILAMPNQYGLVTKAADTWALLYMVHNALTKPEVVWLTYDIDIIPKKLGGDIIPVKALWLDVQKGSANPVFNVQKGFGHVDPETGTRVCRWPGENCARFDAYGRPTAQQGAAGAVPAADVVMKSAGTIIGLGGHLHPGGLRDEVSIKRGNVEKPIFTSDALYWDFVNPSRLGGPKASWNFAMTATGAPLGWKVKVEPGDHIRLNAVYDSDNTSWYENMGIVVAFIAPVDPIAPAGVDVFKDNVVIDPGVSSLAKVPPGPWHANGFVPPRCTPDLTGASGQKRLCLRGSATHGWLAENAHGGYPCAVANGCPAVPAKVGPKVTDVVAVGFTYGEADLGLASSSGVPVAVKGKPIRFWNADGPARIFHTFTRCAAPCTGAVTVNYPTANGGIGDFESMNIGFGWFGDPAKSQLGGTKKYDQGWFTDGLYWQYTPTETGLVTFYCRIHPSMRGAIQVVD
jgi:hypothetical protein